MSRPTRALFFVTLTLLLLTGCGVQSSSFRGSATSKPVFQSTTCAFNVASAFFTRSQIRCGYLVVPESRQVHNGKSIKVAVAVFKAPDAHPAPDPLVYLVGGPGTPIVAATGASIAAGGMPAFAGNRDFILVDQRGVGLSQPSLACRPSDSLASCRTWLTSNGIDLAAYNTVENAADIADLRTVLGYRQMNVLGESYGSTLTLQLMRDHPGAVRSVMMNGVAGPTFNMLNDAIPNTWHGLQQVFHDCAASRDCNTAYPHLAGTFTRLLERLQAHPARLHVYDASQKRYVTGSLTAVQLWWGMNEFLASPANISLVPGLIADMARGDFSSAIQLGQAQRATDQSQVIPGMYESMECSGEQAGSSPARIAARAQAVPIPIAVRRALVASQVANLAGCATWHVPGIPAVNHTYFHSGIPTLLMPGRYDPKTSPPQTYALARHLGHSYVVPFPTLSHEIDWSGCPAGVMNGFLTHPNRRPDTSCAAEMTVLWP